MAQYIKSKEFIKGENMKNFKSIVGTLFTVIILLLVVGQKVNATESEDIATFTTVTIKADVPPDFKQEIVVSLVDEETLVAFNTLLTQDNDYEAKLTVQGNKTYAPAVAVKAGTYKNNLDASYFITGDVADLAFKIEESNPYEPLPSDTVIDTETQQDIPHGEENNIDDLTGLETAESVYNHYKDTASIMEKDTKFKSHLEYYSAAMFKKYFLDADDMNTEDKWNSMSGFERYTYYMLFIKPMSTLYNTAPNNENEFIDNLEAERQMITSIEGGEEIYNEVVDVWRWLYKYYQHTGTFYNFYNVYDDSAAGISSDNEPTTIGKNEETTSLEQIKDAVEAENGLEEEIKEALSGENTEKENLVATWAKNNVVTLIIFAIIGIALVVVTVIVKRKNMDEMG